MKEASYHIFKSHLIVDSWIAFHQKLAFMLQMCEKLGRADGVGDSELDKRLVYQNDHQGLLNVPWLGYIGHHLVVAIIDHIPNGI